jgi:hypothetical protein
MHRTVRWIVGAPFRARPAVIARRSALLHAAVVAGALVSAHLASADEPSANRELGVSITPIVRYVTVDGDEAKFREGWWFRQGWVAGIEEATYEHKFDNGWQIDFEGRGLFDEEDYKLRLQIAKPEVGFVRAGFTEFRSYYDDWGGFFRDFMPAAFRLDRDLFIRNGDIFVEAGLTLPKLPAITLGYERQFRNGEKSLLEWGSVTQGTTTRKIFPAFKDLDQTVDIFKAQVEHDINNVHLANQFRFEHYRDDTSRTEATLNLNTSASKTIVINETYSHDAFYNTFRADSHLNEKVYWSLGYMYATLDGDAGLNIDTTPFNAANDRDWFTRAVAVDLHSHVANLSVMVGPFKGLSLYGGVQAERTDSDGFTDAILRQLGAGGVTNSPASLIRSSNNKDSLEGRFGLRYTQIPFTTLYAEGKLTEQNIDLDEQDSGDPTLAFQRRTDTSVSRQDYMAGFNTSPLRRMTLGARYQHSIHKDDYDHLIDTVPGYSAFITAQEFTTDEIMAKLTLRPMSRLSVSFKYQLIATDIDTDTEAVAPLVPGGKLQSGNFDSTIYSVSATVTPVNRMYCTALLSYRDTRTIAFDNGSLAVLTYHGDGYSILGAVGYALDEKTDLRAEYSFSRADNFQDNSADGLPLGIDYERHGLLVSLTRRIKENIIARLRYGFYDYQESSAGGITDYTAHLASASCTLRF